MKKHSLHIVLGLIALVLSYLGLGAPNHVYQGVAGLLLVGIACHRGWITRPTTPAGWLLISINFGVVAMLAKLAIGGGVRLPFAWLKFPSWESGTEGWIALPQLVWQHTPLSDWPMDLTRIQSFLFILTVAAAWTRFQPFASMTALLLIIASLPAYADFSWDSVLPAMVAAFVFFYAQASKGPAPSQPRA